MLLQAQRSDQIPEQPLNASPMKHRLDGRNVNDISSDTCWIALGLPDRVHIIILYTSHSTPLDAALHKLQHMVSSGITNVQELIKSACVPVTLGLPAGEQTRRHLH